MDLPNLSRMLPAIAVILWCNLLAVLANGNTRNQDKVAAAAGIEPLVALLGSESGERAMEQASAALWSLATEHYANQVAIAPLPTCCYFLLATSY